MNVPGGFGHSDIDTLALAVRDRESQRLIGEAIAAYRGGALRSALISTWIAVAYDIIAKARELANQGEAVPKAFVDELDRAITGNNLQKLQAIENGLLKKANENFQLLAPHEYIALKRIQKDRNLCAHPAFVVEDELYQPTPELVRGHIVHAMQFLLVHAPLQGKSAIKRFKADMLSPSFPVTSDDIGTFIRAKYLDRAKDVLIVNLIKAILAAPFGTDHEKYTGHIRTLAFTLREIANAKTAIYDAEVPGIVSRKFGQVDDKVLLNICPFLENDQRIWEWLPDTEQMRIQRLLETVDVETLKTHSAFDVFAIESLGSILLDRYESFDDTIKISIIREHPKEEFVQSGIEIYADAGSFRGAESLGQSIILPLAPFFRAENIQTTLQAVAGNGQIWNSGGTTEILEQLFDQTRHLLPESQPHWQAFVDQQIEQMNNNKTTHYAYPGLQQRLAE